MTDEEGIEQQLTDALREAGANFADALDGEVYVEWYLSELLEFCREWRSEIEELG
ncbi:hypothetical protein SEA_LEEROYJENKINS_86 [Microbacterium phage LeeroyJenkins]|nr:hypothetical protein SEA_LEEROYJENKINS_86 [Microbacterium phage LeeroyJenkins]